jgi:hypothetical protein
MTTTTRVLTWIAIAGAIGLTVFGFLAWRSVHVEHMEANEALRRFVEIRERFSGQEPILRIGPDGRMMRRSAPTSPMQAPEDFYVLAYHAAAQRLVRADVPFWFLTLKGPAAQFALRGTGLDLDRLGASPADLKRYGPSLILDEVSADGGRLLVWTE